MISCEGPLTEEECRAAICSMLPNKSPGSDGLPSEFYRVFWDDIKDLVVNSYTYAFQKGFFAEEQGRAIITLIPKTSENNKYLKNWRPIALLNTDYKIAAKSIASRFKQVLPSLISPEQTGFLKGRYIGENIRLVLDLIWYCKEYVTHGALLFLDFGKAFDHLDWDFIHNTLSYYNFGPSVRQWVRTLYNNTSSCILNNGFASDYFRVSRGVRQGCPLSPYLFIICTEIFISMINFNTHIHGISILNETIKISQYADDTVIITDGSYESLLEVNSVLQNFYAVPGLRVNSHKSFLFPLGPFSTNHPNYFDAFDFRIRSYMKYLGISFTHHEEDFFRLNYAPKLSRIKNLLNVWSSRDLTPIGKIVIIKTFAISQLVFVLTVPQTSFIE